MRRGPGHDPDDERRAGEPAALERDRFGLCRRVVGPERRRDRLADPAPRLAFEHDEPPRRQPAVVRHPRRDGEQRLDLLGRRAGVGEKVRRDRAAGLQEGEGFVHVRFMGSEP